MTESQLLTSLVAAMFGLLCALLGWIGSSMNKRLDELQHTITSFTAELHDRITGIDKRLVRVETRCDFEHSQE